jgi:hypothetical protein
VLAFAGMTERGEVPSANSQHSEVNERLSPQGRETWRWLFLLLFAPKYQPCVGSPLQISWVFEQHAPPKTAKNLAVRGYSWLFSRKPGRQRIANAWRPEITNLTAKLQVTIPI